MRIDKWESTIQAIVEESNQETTEGRKNRVLVEWRSKLTKEPACLSPQQIDEIVREVRQRIGR